MQIKTDLHPVWTSVGWFLVFTKNLWFQLNFFNKNCLRSSFTLIFQKSRILFRVQFCKKLNLEFGFENQIQFWSSSY